MKGDIAQRSIRSSISRTVEVRPPRMISWVTGSITVAGPASPGALGTCPDRDAWRLCSAWRDSFHGRPRGRWHSGRALALQDEVERSVHARAEARRHERRRVLLIHDRGAGERHAGPEAVARVAGRRGGPGSAEVDRAAPDERLSDVGAAGGDGRRGALGETADRGDAEVDELDRRPRQVVRVETAVLAVEPREELAQVLRRERPFGGRAGQLEALVLVAEVGGALEALPVARHLLAVEPGARPRLEPGPCGLERPDVAAVRGGPALGRPDGPHERRADVGIEEPPRREHAGPQRDDDRRDVEQLGEPAGVERAGTAEGDQREAARIVAPPDRDRPDGARHRVVDDLDDPGRRLVHAEPERAGDPRLDGGSRRAHVERELAAEERRGDAAEREEGDGDGRLGPAAAVAHRARLGAGAPRADREASGAARDGDAPAAGPDRVDVEHR